VYTVFIGY